MPSLKPIAPIILNFETLLGAIFSIFLLVKLGRKTILQAGTFILTVSLIFITVGFFIIDIAYTPGTALILIGLVVYMFTFGATLGSVIWLYIAEICEPSYTIIATVITWIFAVIVIVLFPILKTQLPNQSPAILFLFFLLWTGLSFIVNHKVLIETKGKTEKQIHEEYSAMTLCGNLFKKTPVAPT